MQSVMVRLRAITVLSLLLGCTPLPPRPSATSGDGSPAMDTPDALTDGAALTPDVTPDGDAPSPPDVAPDVAVPDAPPDAPPPSAARLTGTFVSSGSTSPRLSGGFVWHGGSSRLSGWLQ